MDTFVDRFWAKVQKGDGCWEWQGEKARKGYGRARIRYAQGKPDQRRACVLAHRFSWFVTFGPIPDGIQVLHHCDNPPCVRPNHLFLGTNADNVADMVAKGRQRGGGKGGNRGERQGHHRLTDALVRLIRQQVTAGVSQAELARQLGVSHDTVGHVVRGESWRHV